MPLMIMSQNVADRESPSSRKRSRDEYSNESASNAPVKTESQHDVSMAQSALGTAIPPRVAMSLIQSPPAQSSPAALTDAGASTPASGPASPNTPTRQPLQLVPSGHNIPTATQPATMPPPNTVLPTGLAPPKKKRKLTPAERAVKDAEDAARKATKEAEEAARKAEREKKLTEKENQKLIDEEKKRLRQAEAEAKRKFKAERRLEHERKEREKKEEAERKARAQMKIGAFFIKKDPVTPKAAPTVDAVVKVRSPSPAAAQTEYAKLALPFFVHSTVSMARNAFDADEETREAKTRILTEHLNGDRPPVPLRPFDPVMSLQVPSPSTRGRSFPSVRDLMADQDGGASNPIDLIAESLRLPTRRSLKEIPLKQLSFHEDVRPGYYGTVTSVQSVAKLKKMARNPMAKDLPLNYDYDSEAEWVQGEEEEDEAIDDMTDDDEEEGDEKSLDGFLDDDDDDVVRPTGRLMLGNMEPESSGICFEDYLRVNPKPQMYKLRMEFLIPGLQHHHSIDPFSTAYWPSSSKSTTSISPGQNTKTKSADKTPKAKSGETVVETIMPPPPAPSKTDVTSSKKPASPSDLVPANHLEDFKAAVMDFKYLAKSALLPTLKKRFDRCTSAQIKATLEQVAEKHGRKDWELKPTP
ncbi:unnamed protein product [Discula destructiva]